LPAALTDASNPFAPGQRRALAGVDDFAADARAELLEDLDLLQKLLVAAKQQRDKTIVQAVLEVAGKRQAQLDELVEQ
jgi:hypothetical protein